MLRILVTGGLGFIGSNFIRLMMEKHEDIQVTNLDKLSTGSNPNNLKEIDKDKRYKFVKGDVADTNLVENLVRETDAVVNFAAETHVDRSIADPLPFIHSNSVGAVSVFEVARKHNTRVLQVSTDEVYGSIAKGSFAEDSRMQPSSPYSASKAAADLFAISYNRTYGLDVVIARCTNNFGPRQFPEKLIPKTIIRTLLGHPIPVYGKGQNVRDWIYVLDFCEALDLLLSEGRSGVIYNVSTGNELKNIDVVTQILRIMNKDESAISLVEDRPGHDLRYSLDSSRLRSELGWKPKRSLREAIESTIQWYIRNRWWWKPLATDQVLHPTPWKQKQELRQPI
jgi:dTDP-glucose 4,6-dehydratase